MGSGLLLDGLDDCERSVFALVFVIGRIWIEMVCLNTSRLKDGKQGQKMSNKKASTILGHHTQIRHAATTLWVVAEETQSG